MSEYKIHKFPKSRIATIDVCEIGKQKHHIAGMIEIDISESRGKIRKYKREKGRISLTAWLIKAICLTLKEYEAAAAYLKGNRKIVVFNDINVSIIVEKKINGQKVPIPVIIEKVNERTIESITKQISDAQESVLTEKDIVLQRKSDRMEQFYYLLPGFIRRAVWRFLLKHPRMAFNRMGNVAITSVSMMGNVNGWFIPVSVHPVCFGIGAIMKKPVVVDDKIEIREMVNMTILLDHDVFDGANMARFINDLSKNIKNGTGL